MKKACYFLLIVIFTATMLFLSGCRKSEPEKKTATPAVQAEAAESDVDAEADQLVPLSIPEYSSGHIDFIPHSTIPNLETYTPGPRPDFMVPKGTTNVALNKTVTSSSSKLLMGKLPMITDGIRGPHNPYSIRVVLEEGLQWITIDLESKYDLQAILVWHYNMMYPVYCDVIVQVSNDPDFNTGVVTLFNNDHDNSAKMGTGHDKHYIEMPEGKLIDARGNQARYVRLFSNGRATCESNASYVEVEVHAVDYMKPAVQIDSTKNWPSYKPKFPPIDKTFSNLTPQELIPYVLGDKVIASENDNYNGRYGQRLACAWFIWKTRGKSEIREKLADAIFLKLFCVKSRHDNSHLAQFLGYLEMPDHLTALLEITGLDCCYGPSLVDGLSQCGSIEYAPVLIRAIDKDFQGCIISGLIKTTGRDIDRNKPGDRKQQKADWTAWWQKTYPGKKLQPPSNKYRQLLSEDRIQTLRKLRQVIGAMFMYKYARDKEKPAQEGYPQLPRQLDELIGIECDSGEKITQRHLKAIDYLFPAKKNGFDIWNQPLMYDNSLQKNHNLIAVAYYDGTINLLKPEDIPDAQVEGKGASGQVVKRKREPIYDVNANADKQIAEALVRAGRNNKHVLLMYGGNWCGWCYRLHDCFKENADIKKLLKYEYEIVMVDINSNADLPKRFGARADGYPYLTVLDAKGKALVNQSTVPLEEGPAHDPDKVHAFLARWKPKPLNAGKVYEEALALAAKENKLVFLHFGAPWCGWCHRLEDFLALPEIDRILTQDYVLVGIDIERMAGAEAIDKRIRQGKGGVPWIGILDAKGKLLTTSMGPEGNIGYPVKPDEIAHFIDMISKTARNITSEQVSALEKVLGSKQKN